MNDNCKRYCDQYPCQRTKCDRVILFKEGVHTVMVEKEEAEYWDYNMKKFLWREARNTKLN